VTSIEASLTYEVEARYEDRMPTRALTLIDATAWLEELCAAEDLDPPILRRERMSRNVEATALPDEWCIVVRDVAPTQHTILHELTHLSCANKGHGAEFRTQLVRFTRRHISVEHAAFLHRLFVEADLRVDPFEATR
jgi:hypothetical protein